eukprot:scaffold13458_cov39-Tisochrysis_lutea.AAC.3
MKPDRHPPRASSWCPRPQGQRAACTCRGDGDYETRLSPVFGHRGVSAARCASWSIRARGGACAEEPIEGRQGRAAGSLAWTGVTPHRLAINLRDAAKWRVRWFELREGWR